MGSLTPTQKAFETARSEFLQNVKDASKYEFWKYSSIDDVYNVTDEIQEQQAKTGNLRNLRKIQPYLERVQDFAGVIETFVQAKPEVLALLWGPIKLLLQLSTGLLKSFDSTIEVLAKIGEKLPHFQSYAELFASHDRVQQVLCLFYRDVLDVHATLLNFFSEKKWKLIFESIWPKYKSRITLIERNIERHSILLNAEVNLGNIIDEQTYRANVLDKHQRDQEFQERHDFEAVQSYFSPRIYDEELDRLQYNSCPKTGNWLEKEQDFCDWIDSSNNSTRLLWLHGIPGAGKTYLSAAIVTKMKTTQSRNPIFVFLSYKYSQSTTPIDILHSLIFQLALEDKNLQTILSSFSPTHRRDLKGSTSFARDTLLKLVQCTQVTHIIVDGLDEIGETNRQRFLQELLTIWQKCEEMKILVSSRYETDIAHMLPPETKHIRIGRKNAGNIQTYVSQRTHEWLSKAGFDDEARSEIQDLLFPLAAQAKGMFLFARVVIDSLSQLHTVDEVREEIKVLPKDLYEAYGRILERINKLDSKLQMRAKRVLGWIGCSKTPLKSLEVMQALSVRKGERSFHPTGRLFLNILQMCGPIVEFQGEYLYLVHFTAHKYLFERSTESYLCLAQANQNLAETCILYLTYSYFDLDITDEEIDDHIISGNYMFQSFAVSQWYPLLEQCFSGIKAVSDFGGLDSCIQNLIHERVNLAYEGDLKCDADKNTLAKFKGLSPEVQKILVIVKNFWYSSAHDGSLVEGGSWINKDPFTISAACQRIYHRHEALANATTRNERAGNRLLLRQHYGSNIFKCDRLLCSMARTGFNTPALRDAHCLHHARPFKCTISSCDFAAIGFLSQTELEQHWLKCHRETCIATSSEHLRDLDDDSVGVLALDLIGTNDIAGFNALASRIQKLKEPSRRQVFSSGLKTASSGSHAAMVELMIQEAQRVYAGEYIVEELILGAAIELLEDDDVQISKYLVRSHSDMFSKGWDIPKYLAGGNRALFVHKLMEIGSPEMVELWLDREQVPNTLEGIFSQELLRSDASRSSEMALSAIWKKRYSQGLVAPKMASECLKSVAQCSCSITLGRTLLEMGGDINYQIKKNAGSPLQHAAKKRSREAAEFIKFLLLSGADPTRSRTGTKIENEQGAKNISKWLGKSWEELVEWAKAEREVRSEDWMGDAFEDHSDATRPIALRPKA